MAHHYDADISIAEVMGTIPTYGCAIILRYDGDECYITSGLGSSDSLAKCMRIINAAARHKDPIFNITENFQKFPSEMACPDPCITNMDYAHYAARQQTYSFRTIDNERPKPERT